MRGKIARLIHHRGFGFIRSQRGEEFFFHASAVRDGTFEALKEGQRVTFDPQEALRRGRPRAANVGPVSPSAARPPVEAH